MTDTKLTVQQLDAQIKALQEQKNQEVNAEFEQEIYTYFSQFPQDQIMAIIGKLLTSNPMMIMQVKMYIKNNPVPTADTPKD